MKVFNAIQVKYKKIYIYENKQKNFNMLDENLSRYDKTIKDYFINQLCPIHIKSMSSCYNKKFHYHLTQFLMDQYKFVVPDNKLGLMLYTQI